MKWRLIFYGHRKHSSQTGKQAASILDRPQDHFPIFHFPFPNCLSCFWFFFFFCFFFCGCSPLTATILRFIKLFQWLRVVAVVVVVSFWGSCLPKTSGCLACSLYPSLSLSLSLCHSCLSGLLLFSIILFAFELKISIWAL